MASPKKKTTAKPSVRFKDLKAKKNPKGGTLVSSFSKTLTTKHGPL
jgi:hypothetical protein